MYDTLYIIYIHLTVGMNKLFAKILNKSLTTSYKLTNTYLNSHVFSRQKYSMVAFTENTYCVKDIQLTRPITSLSSSKSKPKKNNMLRSYIPNRQPTKINDFIIACVDSNLETVKDIVRTHKLTGEDVVICKNFIFRIVCKNNDLELLEYLTKTFKLVRQDWDDDDDDKDTINDMFIRACHNGSLEVAKYIAQTFKLTRDDITAHNNYAFKKASQYGHLKILKYLTETFGLTRKDAICDNNMAYRLACENGQLNTLKYLKRTFKITRKDVIGSANSAIFAACGHLKILKYLVCTFKLGKKHINYDIFRIFEHACFNGNLEMLIYVTETFGIAKTETFGITEEDAVSAAVHHVFISACFISACEGGHMNIVKYLTETFKLDQKNIIKSANDYETAEHLAKTLGITLD